MTQGESASVAENDKAPQEQEHSVVIDVDCVPFYNYALAHVMSTPLRGMTIENNLDTPIENITISIDSATDLLTDIDIQIPLIPAGTTMEIDCSTVRVDIERMLQLTEAMTDHLNIKFIDGEKVAVENTYEIIFYAFDQWIGMPESLAAFATPNHPALANIIVAASKYLQEWTGNSAFDGYQSEDPSRARLQAAALYYAIRDHGIVYTGAPASFSAGQRVRMPDAVLEQHMATCLDFAVLYAAVLEAVSLRPLIILINGHAFAGVWLEEKSFPEIIVEDYTFLSKRCSAGVSEITVCECTTMSNDSEITFEQAEATGRGNLNMETFQYAVDVFRAREGGIYPLPTRVMGDSGWKVDIDIKTAEGTVAATPTERKISNAYLDIENEQKTKKQLWERNLLDLSMNNNLLNMRPGKRAMPIFVPQIDDVEDTLAGNNDLIVAARPEGFPDISDTDAFRISGLSESASGLLDAELKEGRLRTAFSESALKKNLDNLYRAARSSLEESGANTLFLTLGTLQWVDTKRGNQVRYAPIMLFPIEIVRKSAQAGYRIRFRDEDPQVNISLIEMLRNDYEISINGLDPLPTDEAGVDTRLVLNTFNKKIMSMAGWEVLEEAAIGLFSFSQFVMWNDIRSHEDALRKNKIVDSMMEGHLTWTPETLDPDNPVDPSELLLPIEADESQMFAIRSAIEGKSFVLHGPPGTGKSQTITAIISNALARGKKVLFVAEKMAALEVVENRLAALGLGTFCLEIHSTKATKNHVLEQIQAAAEIGKTPHSDAYANTAREVQLLREQLDAYAHGLSQRNAAGLSLRTQICNYEHFKAIAEPLSMDTDFVKAIRSAEDFAVKMNSAERLVVLASPLAPMNEHPLFGIEGSEFSQSLRNKLPDLLAAYRTALDNLQAKASALTAVQEAGKQTSTFAELKALYESACRVVVLSDLPAAWLALDDLAPIPQAITSAHQVAEQRETWKRQMLERWNESFFSLDAESLKRRFLEAKTLRHRKRSKALQQIAAEISFSSKIPIDEGNVEQVLRELEGSKAYLAQTLDYLSGFDTYLQPYKLINSEYDWQTAADDAQKLETLLANANRPDKAAKEASADSSIVALYQQFKDAYDHLMSGRDALDDAMGLSTLDSRDNTATSWLETEKHFCDRVSSHVDDLRGWMNWNAAAAKAREFGMVALVHELEENHVSEDLLDRFKGGVYRAMCMESLDRIGGMNGFSGARFDETVRQYARSDEQLRNLAKQEIYYQVASRTPNLTLASVTNPHAAQLQKSLRSRGRNVSIRSVMHDTGDVVRDLCPCFLMSPLSVAQYLEPGEQVFDLLIFDEASQLQTCKAIGPLSRAKEAVIVGDPRQMPPTSFFQGKTDSEDYEAVNDLESVLEDCLALNMPQTYLKWHYRSQHESLIAFSNRRFYEGKMFTFPSADDRASRLSFIKVDGYFDRGNKRVNVAEAEAIVAELKRRATDPELSKQSVGVVTFNVPQQTLIENLFQQACATDTIFEKWATEGTEPLFIKNLENVQGDERDVIMFSITYAPDKSGKMSMNFGPINREGGWRRLNVAVTRARVNMTVFSSMGPEDIDLNRVSSMGPASLKAFLQFARQGTFGSLSYENGSIESDEDTIASELCARLQSARYETHRNVGRSLFKVDIGVMDPYDNSRYLAGILLDGRNYSLAKTTRDREIAKPTLLRRLGWNECRVWAVDWWEDADGVTNDLIAFLDGAKEEAALRAPESKHEEPRAERTDAKKPSLDSASTTAVTEAGVSEITDTPIRPPFEEVNEPTGPESEKESPVENQKENQSENAMVEEADKTVDRKPIEPMAAVQPITTPHIAQAAENLAAPHPTKEPYNVTQLPEQNGMDAFDAMEDRDLANIVEQVLEVESPIEESLLIRRVSQSFGFARTGSHIQARLSQAIKIAKCIQVSQAKRNIIWRKGQNPKTYLTYRYASEDARREIGDIPLEEFVAAAVDTLIDRGTLTQDELVKESASALGYQRATKVVVEFMKKGFALGVRRGLLSRDGNTYSLAVQPSPDDSASMMAAAVNNSPEAPPTQALAHPKELDFMFDAMGSFLSDGVISIDEVATLQLWVTTHKSLQEYEAYRQVSEMLNSVLEDGALSDAEAAQLKTLFEDLLGKSNVE